MITGYILKSLAVPVIISLMTLLLPAHPASAADPNTTTSVTIKKLAASGATIDVRTVTYQWLRDNLPVMGDGTTHYYLQGPVFKDDPDPETQDLLRWNEEEDTNLKDWGAVKGTNLTDLCDLVGGMEDGDTLTIKGKDGWNKDFAYKNIYEYSDTEGPMVLAWSYNGKYPDSGYTEGMRTVWLADDSVNPEQLHCMGNWDWHEAADPEYWYFYDEDYPTTTGLSAKYVSEITIHSSVPDWDLNADHYCDVSDLVIIGRHWGETGADGWILADFNRDGTVNILDIVAIGYYWGQDW
jgi:hypothetical protein